MDKVTRIHVKTGCSDRAALIDYCLHRDQQVLVIGWRCVYDDDGKKRNSPKSFSTYDTYFKAVQKWVKKHGRRLNHALNVFAKVKDNDLFWTRDLNGAYWICRATGKAVPKYDYDMDIGAEISVEAYKVGMQVPGQICAAFNRANGGICQNIYDTFIVEYSKHVFNQKAEREQYQVTKQEGSILDNLPPFDLEELVIAYIQIVENYYVLSNSIAKKSTSVKIECEFISRDLKKPLKAVVQVKAKKYEKELDALSFKDYISDGYVVYLYAPKIVNMEKCGDSCVEITEKELMAFYKRFKKNLPESITMWENIFD